MRLGGQVCRLTPGSRARALYNSEFVRERHRHRYEFNNEFRELLSQRGLLVAGVSEDGELVEIIENEGHPWFIGCQFHPEFKSKPLDCHPLFRGFIRAAVVRRNAAGDTLPLGNLRAARS